MRVVRSFASLIVAGTVALSLGPTGHASEPSTKSAPPATAPARPDARHEALKDMVNDYARRNADLEFENARLKLRIRELESRQMAVREVRERAPLPRVEPVPPHWVPKQFNGETFYLIPLKSGN